MGTRERQERIEKEEKKILPKLDHRATVLTVDLNF